MSRPNTSFDDDDTLDVLRGVPAIARFVRKTKRMTYHGLQTGIIPGIKEGALWVTTKSRLRRHYNGEDALPPPKAAEEQSQQQPLKRRRIGGRHA